MRALLLALVMCAACGAPSGPSNGGGGGGGNGGCDTRPQNGVCIDYDGPADVVAAYKGACSPGTWLDSGCPKADRVGGCRLAEASLKLTYTQWSYPSAWTRASVMQACTTGTFVDP